MTTACPFVKGPKKINDKVICVVLDIKLDTNSFNNAFLDVLDFAQETQKKAKRMEFYGVNKEGI